MTEQQWNAIWKPVWDAIEEIRREHPGAAVALTGLEEDVLWDFFGAVERQARSDALAGLGALGDDAGSAVVEAEDGAAVRLRDLVMESGLDAEVHAGSMYGVNAPIVRASAAEGRVVVEVPALEGATA